MPLRAEQPLWAFISPKWSRVRRPFASRRDAVVAGENWTTMSRIAPDVQIPTVKAVRFRNCPRAGRSRWLYDANDRLYVVKPRRVDDDPLSVPAREAYCWLLCRALGISTPAAVAVDPCEFLKEEAQPLEGAHSYRLFGSEAPYRLGTLFDYVPRGRLEQVSNRSEMLTWPVFDLWVGNAALTQVVFLKTGPKTFRGLKINHSRCLDIRSCSLRGPSTLRAACRHRRADQTQPAG